jgi:hypothetical protein
MRLPVRIGGPQATWTEILAVMKELRQNGLALRPP